MKWVSPFLTELSVEFWRSLGSSAYAKSLVRTHYDPRRSKNAFSPRRVGSDIVRPRGLLTEGSRVWISMFGQEPRVRSREGWDRVMRWNWGIY